MFRIHSTTLLVCSALLPAFAAAADPGDPSSDVPAVAYRSTLDSYRRHSPEPVRSWRAANDTVGRQDALHDHSAHDLDSQGAADLHAGHSVPADPHAGHPGHGAPDGKPAAGADPGRHHHHHPKSDASAQSADTPHACPHCSMKEGGSDHAHQ